MKMSLEDIRKSNKKQECLELIKIKRQETFINNNRNFIQNMDRRKVKVGLWPKKIELGNKEKK